MPFTIGTWCGKVIIVKAASYTLMYECLWVEIKGSENNLEPWTESPLYLANGEATIPLGWENNLRSPSRSYVHGEISLRLLDGSRLRFYI